MISIVTPSFGQLDWLRLCIASVADQESVEMEHIVQDGGTPGLELDAASGRRHVKVFVEKDTGMYDAINRGFSKAQGEICGYLNCDEQYLPGTLRQVADYFALHPAVDVLFGDAILINSEGHPISYRRTTLPTLSHLRVATLNTLSCATFFRRRIITEGHLFAVHLKVAGDQLWIFELLKAEVKMAVLQKPLSVFTFTGSNLSESREATRERFGWLPSDEKPQLWKTPLLVGWHRLRKYHAGAYRRRDVTIRIYTFASPSKRQTISARQVGYEWPRNAQARTA